MFNKDKQSLTVDQLLHHPWAVDLQRDDHDNQGSIVTGLYDLMSDRNRLSMKRQRTVPSRDLSEYVDRSPPPSELVFMNRRESLYSGISS
jgi:hypothetical protein